MQSFFSVAWKPVTLHMGWGFFSYNGAELQQHLWHKEHISLEVDLRAGQVQVKSWTIQHRLVFLFILFSKVCWLSHNSTCWQQQQQGLSVWWELFSSPLYRLSAPAVLICSSLKCLCTAQTFIWKGGRGQRGGLDTRLLTLYPSHCSRGWSVQIWMQRFL